VVEGLALLGGWLELTALIGVLAFFLLRHHP
jgi:hypothetical protein